MLVAYRGGDDLLVTSHCGRPFLDKSRAFCCVEISRIVASSLASYLFCQVALVQSDTSELFASCLEGTGVEAVDSEGDRTWLAHGCAFCSECRFFQSCWGLLDDFGLLCVGGWVSCPCCD